MSKFIAASLFEARSETPLSEKQLRVLAPSIFQKRKYETCSAKFKHYSTWDAICALKDKGFEPVSARQGGTRIEGKAPFTKHLVRFRRADALTITERQTPTGFVPEILLMNAHDKTSSWRVLGGGFRPICKNGLVAKDQALEERIGHTKHDIGDVIDATFRVVEHCERLTDQTQKWANLRLTEKQRMDMARFAHDLRFNTQGRFGFRANERTRDAIEISDMLAPRRDEDKSPDLWTVFNRIQENVFKGGQTGVKRWTDEDGKDRELSFTVRELNSMRAEIDCNRVLWDMASSMFTQRSLAHVTA